nr:ureidoglycolate hydrolase [Tanacetum cinerariifolium]
RRILLLNLMMMNIMVMGGIIQDDNEIIKTRMQDFSGYKFPLQDDSSSFTVDSLNLQKQIDELSSFSDSPLPSVTRIL